MSKKPDLEAEPLRVQRPIYAIFEGGGARGIGHVGGLAAADEARLAFVGVAGASAGAIVATLIAAGYRAENLMRLDSRDDNLLTRMGLSPTKILGEHGWRSLRHVIRRHRSLAKWWSVFGVGMGSLFERQAAEVLKASFTKLGHLSTQGVADFIDEAVRLRLRQIYDKNGLSNVAVPKPVRFGHLDTSRFLELRPLKIIVTDIDDQRAILFDRRDHADVAIGEAVAASVAIPGIFEPALIPSFVHAPPDAQNPTGRDVSGHRFADGGLVANLPVHVFVEEKLAFERRNPQYGRVPVVAFSLVDPPETDKTAAKSIIDYGKAVARAAIFGGKP